jgi:D-glycero-beta-D-manno-heptose 1-phosphate adenylyltransferase
MIATTSKVRGLEDAVSWRREQSGILVFTNGVFDLIHPGHVELLERARREGDALIVGVIVKALFLPIIGVIEGLQ